VNVARLTRHLVVGTGMPVGRHLRRPSGVHDEPPESVARAPILSWDRRRKFGQEYLTVRNGRLASFGKPYAVPPVLFAIPKLAELSVHLSLCCVRTSYLPCGACPLAEDSPLVKNRIATIRENRFMASCSLSPSNPIRARLLSSLMDSTVQPREGAYGIRIS
jgi:hypothetical protein